jgi:DNA polymerase-4
MMEDLTPLVEPISIDEAFLDLTGTERLHKDSPARVLAVSFAARVEREIGITVSVGLSYCKFLAKVASDLDKPRGFSVIGKAGGAGFPGGPRSVTLIWGVGKAFAATLEKRRHTHHRAIADDGRNDPDEALRRDGKAALSPGARRR